MIWPRNSSSPQRNTVKNFLYKREGMTSILKTIMIPVVEVRDANKGKPTPPESGSFWVYVGKGTLDVEAVNSQGAIWLRIEMKDVFGKMFNTDGRLAVIFKRSFTPPLNLEVVLDTTGLVEALKIGPYTHAVFRNAVEPDEERLAKEGHEQFSSLGRPIETLTITEIISELAMRLSQPVDSLIFSLAKGKLCISPGRKHHKEDKCRKHHKKHKCRCS